MRKTNQERLKPKPDVKITRVGGGIFKRTIKQLDKPVQSNFGLTNRPEFQSRSLGQKSSATKKRNEHEENMPETGGRLVIRNLDFNVKGEDLEDAFTAFGTIIKYVELHASAYVGSLHALKLLGIFIPETLIILPHVSPHVLLRDMR